MRVTVFGDQLVAQLANEKDQHVPKSTKPGCQHLYDSDHLVWWHIQLRQRGIVGAEMIRSIYGWSLRYDSGLMDFALIASSRCGDVDGSFHDCKRYAENWVAYDPTRRYVTIPSFEMMKYLNEIQV